MRVNTEAVGIGDVIVTELADVCHRRGFEPASFDPANWQNECHRQKLSGLCISGGGIRSATFGLGVLQGLAQRNLLEKIDYLSTVSGGGYVGSWLQAVVYRLGSFSPLTRTVPGPSAEDPITFLRKYSNYLAPRPGFSLDSFVIPVIWLRNTILNQAILLCAFVALFVVVLCPGIGLQAQAENGGRVPAWIELGLAAIAGTWAVVSIARHLKSTAKRSFDIHKREEFGSDKGTERVGWTVVVPLTAGVILILLSVISSETSTTRVWLPWIALAILWILHALLQWLGGFVLCCRKRRNVSAANLVPHLHVLWMSSSSALFTLALFAAIHALLRFWNPLSDSGTQYIIAFGPPLYLVALIAGVSLQIGLMGQDFPDASREWLARCGAFLFTVVACWTALFSIVIFAPLGIAKLWFYSKTVWSSAAGAWIASTIATVLAGKSNKTGSGVTEPTRNQNRILDAIARYGPFVAVPIFMIAVGTFVQFALFLPSLLSGSHLKEFSIAYWSRLAFHEPFSWLIPVVLFGAAVVIGIVLSLRVNINEFSLHYFYKNRLVRCYLGASNTQFRQADPFTGFDPQDDILLEKLRCDTPRTSPGAPFPIINACLNVTAGTELATQERKGIGWTFTPRFSGFVPSRSDADRRAAGEEVYDRAFVDTKRILGGVHLGTAFSISGAALGPNEGFHSSPQTAFLLTLFNVRLGWWTGNPRDRATWSRTGPLFALRWLVLEMLGFVNERSAYLNLSDGGHFENLGLYELVRRRCRFIVAVDGEEDPTYCFESLGAAVRKCRADFGIEIDINPRPITPEKVYSSSHWAVGRIRYPEPGSEPGWLLYLKSSVTGDESADVEEYRRKNSEFPQQPTGDQFFSESQFEAYRELGFHVCQSALGNMRTGAEISDLFEQLSSAPSVTPSASVQESRQATRLAGPQGHP
ncbi:MAG TPA: patatin-like phospholipase family protein [Bryobacteraceae bacterium]|jgi:hypothetical protein